MDQITPPENFYGTDARSIVSTFQEFYKLVQDYVSIGTRKKYPQRFGGLNTILPEKQVIEALQHASTSNFLKSLMQLIAANTRIKKDANNKQNKIQDDLEIIKKTMLAVAQEDSSSRPEYDEDGNPLPTKKLAISMDELEELYQQIYVQDSSLAELLMELEGAQLDSWATRLNEIIKKHRAKWKTLLELLAKQLGEELHNAAGAQPTQLELAEIHAPSRTKEEIVTELQGFHLGKLLPKNIEKTSNFELRVLWIIGAACARSMINVDHKVINKVVKSIMRLEEKERNNLIKQNQTDYDNLVATLNDNKNMLRDIRGLTVDNRNKMMRTMPQEVLQKLITERPSIEPPTLTV